MSGLLGLVLIVAAGPCLAQGAGRWWWDSNLLLTGQNRVTSSGDGPRSSTNGQQLRVGVGLHGFVVHPSAVSFDVNLNTLLSRLEGARTSERSNFGGGLNVELFPRSPIPSGFHLRRLLYDYSERSDSPLASLSSPEVTTEWGGWFRMRAGPLRGGIFTFDHLDTKLEDPDAGREVSDRQRFDWSVRKGNTGHSVGIQRRELGFATVDFESEELSLQVVERGMIGESWTWTATASGLQRTLRESGAESQDVSSYDVNSQHTGWLSPRRRLDMSVALNRTEAVDDTVFDGQRFRVGMRQILNKGWEIGPFADYSRRGAEEESLGGGRLGISALWNSSPRARVQSALQGNVALRRLRSEDQDGSTRETQSVYGITATVAHGNLSGLRKALRLQADFSELRQRGVLIELPDLGLIESSLVTENTYSAELDLDHVWNGQVISSNTEWVRTESTDDGRLASLETDRYVSRLQLELRKLQLGADVGAGRVVPGSAQSQSYRFVGVGGRWAPRSFLNLRARYRKDLRDVNLAPDVDVERYDVGLEIPLGQLRFEAFVEETRQVLDGGPTNRARSFHWSLSSGFAGLLPWETGTRRRGVIR